jgi:hypothetical protein
MSKSDSRRSNWLQSIHQAPGGGTSTNAAEQRRLAWAQEQAAIAAAAAPVFVEPDFSVPTPDADAPPVARSIMEMNKKELIKLLLANPKCSLSEADLEKKRATELREIMASLSNS